MVEKENTEYTLRIGGIAKVLMTIKETEVTTDFATNKKIVKVIFPKISKQMQNRIAGYMARLKKKEKDEIKQ